MKKNWHRIPRGVIVGLLVTALVAGVVLAVAITRTIPGTITVIPQAGLEIFYDSSCTEPVTSIDVGSIMVNETKTIAVRVKNTGQHILDNVTATCDVDPGVASFAATTCPNPIEPGKNDGIDLVFTGKGQGNQSFTVTFEATFTP